MKCKHDNAGFTLIELLVAIVVIAILAAIGVVAYNGIQERAYSAKVIATVESYAGILRMYHTEHGEFPPSGNTASCLGRTSDYPASDGYAAGACIKDSSGSVSNLANDAFADDLAQYVKGQLPDPRLRFAREVWSSTAWTEYRGLYYEQWRSGTTDTAFIEYAVKGKVPCPKAMTTRYREDSNITYCNQRIRLEAG